MSNQYFNNYNSNTEQTLIESLVIESIKQYSIDLFYLPRTVINKDEILNEPTTSSFNSYYETEMYIKNLTGFGGDRTFLSKFQLEIRDELTLTVAIKTFLTDVGTPGNMVRPREGDLIWFPLNKKVFQIKYVPTEAVFYQFGALQMWDIVCELFEWSNEIFNTGIVEIDDKYQAFNTDMQAYKLLDEAGNPLVDENGNILIQAEYDLDEIIDTSQNKEFQIDSRNILDFSEKNIFGEV